LNEHGLKRLTIPEDVLDDLIILLDTPGMIRVPGEHVWSFSYPTLPDGARDRKIH